MILRKLLAFTLLLLFCAGVGQGWHAARGGLRFDRCALNALPSFEGQEPSPEQSQALSQPFRFLAAGRQCYAFESADGKYVLKLPRTDVYRTLPWRSAKDKQSRKAYFFRSIDLSLGVLNNETHLEAVRWAHPVTLTDRLGRTRHISHATWLLQRKASPLFRQLQEALRAQDGAAARRMVQAFAALLSRLQEKNVVCKDLLFVPNIGYDGETASFIDVGSFCPRELWPHPMTAHIRPWLSAQAPELLDLFDQELKY
jgi:hypothetical protein